MWLWLLTEAQAVPIDCDASTEKSTLLALLIEADQAIADLDPDTLADAVARARDAVRCLGTPLSSMEVAHLYRVAGISWYVADDLVRAVEDFAVAKAVDPNASIDTALGKPLRTTWDAVPPPTGEKLVLPRPSEGFIHVDGVRTDEVPADRGYFAQWVTEEGDVRSSWFVTQGQLPPYPTRSGNVAELKKPKGDKGKGVPILVAGIAASLVGVGSMVGAEVLEGQFERSNKPSSQLSGLITANQAMGYSGIGLGVAGVGLMGISFAVGF